MSEASHETVGPPERLDPHEREQFAAMVEHMRQLRRRRGAPDGMSAQEAIALGILSTEELERARWGGDSQAASTVRDGTDALSGVGHDREAVRTGSPSIVE